MRVFRPKERMAFVAPMTPERVLTDIYRREMESLRAIVDVAGNGLASEAPPEVPAPRADTHRS